MKKLMCSIMVVVLSLALSSCGNSVSEIILSTNSIEIEVGKVDRIKYTIVPETSKDKLIWTSVDENIAEVISNDGTIRGKKVGQTTIVLSSKNGISASCTVTVKEKSAYDRLSSKEKKFVDCVLKNLNNFKNPDSVKILNVGDWGDEWETEISASNSFGGIESEQYRLNEKDGFYKELVEVPILSYDEYNIDLINEAINEKR